MSKLRLIPISGSPHEIDLDEAMVGREPSCDVVIPDGSVSRKHARLVRRANGWAVIDQGSANGTFLDSHRVADAQIQAGQELRFGAVAFRTDFEVPTEELHPTLGGLGPTVPGVAHPLPPPPPSPLPARAVAPPPLPPRPARPTVPMAAAPAPARQGKGAVFWTLLGCGGCLTVIVLAVVVIAGGFFVFFKGPVDAVQAQIGEMRAGEIDKAYARLSEDYRARLSRDAFARLVAEHPGLKENAEAGFWPPSGSVHVVNAEASVSGTLVSTGGAREQISCELVKEHGEWKISALRVEAAPSR
jgi:hypothetical protein